MTEAATAGRDVDVDALWRSSEQELLDEVVDVSARIQALEVRRIALVDEIDQRVPASVLGFKTVKPWLVSVTLLNPGQAGRIAKVAAGLRKEPELQKAFSVGSMPLDLTAKILKFCEKPPKLMPDDAKDVARTALINAASGPGANREKIDTTIATLEHMFESDDPPPSEDTDRNSLHASTTLNGRLSMKADVDAETGEMFMTILSGLSKPRPAHDGSPDPRTAEKRRADGFTEMLERYLGSGVGPSEGGEKPHVNLHIRADHLADHQRGHIDIEDFPPDRDDFRWNPEWDRHTEIHFDPDCEPPDDIGSADDWAQWTEELADPAPGLATDSDIPFGAERTADPKGGNSDERRRYYEQLIADGGVGWMPWMGPLTVQTARRLTCDCILSPIILDEHGTPINLGRTVRRATKRQRAALAARDHGCAFPRCGAPVAWAHAHHIKHWVDGGPTDLDNLVLLCGFHHRLIHHSDWEIVMGTDRHPMFVPPRSVDPLRQPVPANNRAGP